jgi:hypothetical protein
MFTPKEGGPRQNYRPQEALMESGFTRLDRHLPILLLELPFEGQTEHNAKFTQKDAAKAKAFKPQERALDSRHLVA